MHSPVILSEAGGSRSEPSAKSKDPISACTTTNSTRNFYSALAVSTGDWQLGTGS
jgi:hypothetical protein